MSRPALLMMAFIATCATETFPQCADITVGTYDGTPVPGNPDTPFSTNTGSNIRRGGRYQYIFPAAELIAAGVCPGPITKVTFYAIGSEYPCDTFVNCPGLRVDLRLGNSGLSNFGPYVAAQSTPLDVDWDEVVAASAQLNVYSNTAFVVDSGAIHFPLIGGGFMWDGAQNLVLDVSWQRGSPIGSSPAVRLVEDLPYTATKWVQVTTGFDVSHGNTYLDNPLPANATTGTTFSRPVTTFNSTAEGLPMVLPDVEDAAVFLTSFDAVTGNVVVNRPGADQEQWTVVCSDITGRTLAQRLFPSGTGTIRIPIDQGYQGAIVVFAVRADGSRLSLGQLISIR